MTDIQWMVDEKELQVIHYTLGLLKPWDWWTPWLLKPVDLWQIAFYVGVHMEEGCKNERGRGLSPEMSQLGVVGAVKVAVRSSSMGAGPSKS